MSAFGGHFFVLIHIYRFSTKQTLLRYNNIGNCHREFISEMLPTEMDQ